MRIKKHKIRSDTKIIKGGDGGGWSPSGFYHPAEATANHQPGSDVAGRPFSRNIRSILCIF